MKSSRFRGGNLLSHRNSFRNWFRTLSISFLYLASLSLILPITWNWLWNWLVVSNPQRLHTVTWPTSAGARSLSWFAASPPRQRCLEFGCAVCYLTAFRRAVSVFVWSVQMKLWMKYCTVMKCPVFGLRKYFFPVVKLSPKEELLKTDLQKEMNRHLKVFCTAIASSEINCGTCIYPCCVLYLFCSTSAFSQFVQYIFGFLWQIFCVWSHHSHHLGSILCISQLHPPAAYIAGLVLFRFYGPMFCCLFVLGSFL